MLSGRDIPVLSARKRCILRRKKKHTGRVQRSAKNDHPSSEIAGLAESTDYDSLAS